MKRTNHDVESVPCVVTIESDFPLVDTARVGFDFKVSNSTQPRGIRRVGGQHFVILAQLQPIRLHNNTKRLRESGRNGVCLILFAPTEFDVSETRIRYERSVSGTSNANSHF